MRRLLVVLAVYGCASVPPPSGSDDGAARPVILTGDRIVEGERPRASITEIPIAPAQAWPAVKRAYQALGIDVIVDNPAMHQLGNASFFKSRSMGGHRMAEFVECGQSMTGPKADTYRIYMSLLTMVNSDGKGGSRIETTFSAAAQDVSAGATDRIPCGSSGKLEQLINESARAGIAKP